MNTSTFAIALISALMLGAPEVVLAADAPGSAPAARTGAGALEAGCKENGGAWTSRGRQGGSCTLTVDPAAKKKKQTLEKWCKDHGGTWTSDGYQGGSCAL